MRRLLLSTTALAALAVAVGLAPASAYAHAAVSHTETFSTVVSDAISGGGNFNNTALDIPAFNTTQQYVTPSSLKSVLVFQKLTAHYSGDAGFPTHHTSGPSSWASVTTAVKFETDLTVSGGPMILGGSPLLSISGAEKTAQSYTYSTTKPFSFSLSQQKPQLGGQTTVFDVANWEQAGGGIIPGVGGTTTTTLLNTGGLTITSHGSPIAALTYTMTGVYNYTTTSGPIPEPATALMLGSGVLALGAARRRRLRKS